MDDMYRQYILDHYQHPHHFGELDDASFEAEGLNPTCGDELKVQVRVDDEQRVVDVAFTGNGCAISQASMSILSDELVGKTLSQIAELDRDYMMELIGIQLSPARVKCALLGLVVVKMGMDEFAGTGTPAGWEGMDELAWDRS